MQAAPRPRDESRRIEALQGYCILDSLPEPAYDDITYLASHICQTPIALVSFVDADRQWFKSRHGLDAAQTPRDVAFCAHAILDPHGLFVVEDATQDPRFADNPLVTGPPHVRFYAGAPLVTPAGQALGTLCVIDSEARTLTAAQANALRALSRQVVAQLELRRTVGELERSSDALERTNETLQRRSTQVERSRDELAALCRILERQADLTQRDLHRAEVIQRSLLPDVPPQLQNFCLHALYRPGRCVGGDLYDVLTVGDRYVVFLIADAAGHGVSAAMLSVLFRLRLVTVDQETGVPFRPAETCRRVNAAMRADVPAPGVFVTAVFCLLDLETRELAVASAGHPPVVWLRSNGETNTIEHTGPALGLYTDAVFGERVLKLEPGDQVLLYTDGLFDVCGETPESIATVSSALRSDAPGMQVLQTVLGATCAGQEREDRDDVTMLLLNARPGQSEFGAAADALEARAPKAAEVRLTIAETPAHTCICVEGRVTWLHAQSVFEAAAAVIEANRTLVIDLSDCEHLDSTLLGTLHELTLRARDRGVALRLQNVPSGLLQAFDELSLSSVAACVRVVAVPVPADRTALPIPEVDVKAQQLRLLRAHELLAALSEDNREQFTAVVAAMRADLAGSGAASRE